MPLIDLGRPKNQENPGGNLNKVVTENVISEEHQMMHNLSLPNENSQDVKVDGAQVKEVFGPPLGAAIGAEMKEQVPPDSPQKQFLAKFTGVPQPQPQQQTQQAQVQQPSVQKQDIKLAGTATGKDKLVRKIINQAGAVTTATPPLQTTQIKAVTKVTKTKIDIDDYLQTTINKNASDLHLSVGYPPMLRIDDVLVSMGGEDLTLESAEELFKKLLNKRHSDELAREFDVDLSYTHKSGNRFRVNIFRKKGVLAGAFRLIPGRIKTIAELGLPNTLFDFTRIPQGLVLFTGPTGSGKSTSIAALIQEINLNQAKHIITIEDPIEYVFPKAKSLVDQREIGTDAKDWHRALREILRQDPDVVLVGEMRDFETIASTITIAETGHLVFATLHTNSASQTMDRIIDVFPEAQQAQVRAQLSNVISAVVAQRLVPVVKGGRKAVIELMIATPAVKNAIREGKTYQIDNIIQTSGDMGMVTLEKALVAMVRNGDLTVEQAQTYTTKPDELMNLMRYNG